MLDFITVPLIVGIITLGIYKLFELMIRRKERLKIIEKIEDVPTEFLKNGISLPSFNEQRQLSAPKRISPIIISGLVIGIGLGLLVTVFVQKMDYLLFREDYYFRSALYGACVLFFGGLGLLSAYFLERVLENKYNKNKDNKHYLDSHNY